MARAPYRVTRVRPGQWAIVNTLTFSVVRVGSFDHCMELISLFCTNSRKDAA